eukprot:10629738-Heterocapsa_arctica.AAC.1
MLGRDRGQRPELPAQLVVEAPRLHRDVRVRGGDGRVGDLFNRGDPDARPLQRRAQQNRPDGRQGGQLRGTDR